MNKMASLDQPEENGEMAADGELSTDQIFQAALEDFRSSLTDSQLTQFEGRNLTDVKLKILGIQKHQERMKGLMNFARMQHHLERFAEFDEVCKTTKIGGELSTELSDYIWGPSDYILLVAPEDPAVLTVVLDAYQKFGKKIPCLGQYKDLISERHKMMKCVAFMYHDLLQFYKRIIQLLTGRGWKGLFLINWKYHEKSFDSLLDSFEAHGKILGRLLEVWRTEQAQKSQQSLSGFVTETHQRLNDHMLNQHGRDSVMHDIMEISEDTHRQLTSHIDASNRVYEQIIRQYERERAEASSCARVAEEDRKKEQKQEVLDWLGSDVQQSTYHEKFLKVRDKTPSIDGQPGTAVWILDETKINNWMNEVSPTNAVMWLRGKKGAGKTVLASTIIEYLIAEIPGFKTSYFYCRAGEGDSNQNTAVAILREMLRQLLLHNQDPLPSCIQKKRISPEQVVTNIDTIKYLLGLFCDRDMNQFIVIDGLDECNLPEIKIVVKFWISMVEKSETYKPGKLRVLFVSQDTADIRKLMSKIETQIFDIKAEQSQKDIEKYIRYRFNKLQELKGLKDKETEDARRQVLERAEGMFLYAVLVVEPLFKQPNIEMLKKELGAGRIPTGLGEAYQKILDEMKSSLDPNQWDMAKKIFGLLAGAGRPLKWHELQAALSISIGNDGKVCMDFHNKKLRNSITETCGPLVQRVQRDRLEFIHSTTRQYILTSKHLNEKVIQCDLTILSLKYLTLDCFRPDLNDDDIGQSIKDGYYAFQDYAIAEWSRHLDKFIQTTRPLFPDQTLFFDDELAGYESKVLDAMESFLRFHRASIDEAAKEKTPPPASQKGRHRSNPSLRASQISLPSLTPPSTQQSSSSRSITPPQSRSEQQEIDPALHCQAFFGLSFYNQLVELWAHVCKHEKRDFTLRPMVSLPGLQKLLETVRTKIAELVASTTREKVAQNREDLIELYGERHHKCVRVRCDFFYEGFSTKGAADAHANKHDRPYPCPVEGCAMVPFGFQTHKDKDRHVRNYHPEESDQPARFVHGQPEGRQTAEAKWPCEICNKKFTRQSILKDHMDAHYGERKHACETCGKKFTRSNDRNRHRKIHVRKLRG